MWLPMPVAVALTLPVTLPLIAVPVVAVPVSEPAFVARKVSF